MEFIIAHTIQIHPLALIFPDRIKDKNVKQTIAQLTQGYADHKSYFIEKLAEGLSMTAAAFYPKEVIVRLSDFKSNEYAKLLGGEDFEPKEENPMLGLRGASRYYHPAFSDAFGLECEAIQRARTSKGFNNIKIMVPFCRTLDEGEKVLEALANHGLVQGEDDLEVYVMAEIPSNILLAEEFSRLFDGFSIGSNDLTQLTLGIDRDSAYLQELFNEMNPAVEILISNLIQAAGKAGKVVGLCGQGPSDNPDFTRFLVRQGINSISFNPDAMLRGLQLIVEAEQEWPSTWNAVEVKHV
jgi:pyruvate,water dikinase